MLLVSALLLARMAYGGNACYEIYTSPSAHIDQSLASKLRGLFEDFTTSDFSQMCQAGVAACSSTIASGAKTSAELVRIQALGLANAAGKVLDPKTMYNAINFEITPTGVRKLIIVPIAEIIKRGKDAAVKLEQIDNGKLDPQSLIKKSFFQKLTFGLLGKIKKSNTEIIEELKELVDRTEIELWGQSYFSFAVATLIGGPKLASTYSINAATMLVSINRGSAEKTVMDLAKALIIHRFQDSFRTYKILPMTERLRRATQDAMTFKVDQEEVMVIKDIVLKEFGFDTLLTEINRDPREEARNLSSTSGSNAI